MKSYILDIKVTQYNLKRKKNYVKIKKILCKIKKI